MSPRAPAIDLDAGIVTLRAWIDALMIASVAITQGLPLYTTNPGGFANLDTLLTLVPVARPDRQGAPDVTSRRGCAPCGDARIRPPG